MTVPKPTNSIKSVIGSAWGALIIILFSAASWRLAWLGDWYDYSHQVTILVAFFILFCGFLVISDVLQLKKHIKNAAMTVFAIVVAVGFVSFHVWMNSQTPLAKYQELSTTGVITSAKVVKISLDRTALLPGPHWPLEIPVHHIGDADKMAVSILYDNGHKADIPVRWNSNSRDTYLVLYNQAQATHSISVRYLPSAPQIVVPELEFSYMNIK